MTVKNLDNGEETFRLENNRLVRAKPILVEEDTSLEDLDRQIDGIQAKVAEYNALLEKLNISRAKYVELLSKR